MMIFLWMWMLHRDLSPSHCVKFYIYAKDISFLTHNTFLCFWFMYKTHLALGKLEDTNNESSIVPTVTQWIALTPNVWLTSNVMVFSLPSAIGSAQGRIHSKKVTEHIP